MPSNRRRPPPVPSDPSSADRRSGRTSHSNRLPAAPADRMEALRSLIDGALRDAVHDRGPDVLYDPIRYVLDGNGKRLRPILLLLVADALGTDVDRALPAALAVEVFHNFTLVHDDIMDDSDERRGRPTVHTASDRGWDTATAILTGDMMMGLSYELLSDLDDRTDHRAVFAAYHPMVEHLCSGQARDEALEDRPNASVDDYLQMIDGKTVALFATVFELGAILGDASADERSVLRRAGRDLGRGFQIQDDWLDIVGNQTETGKPVGGDLLNGKKTFVTLTALDAAGADREAWLRSILDRPDVSASEVDAVRRWMEEAGVFETTRDAFTSYFDAAREGLAVLPPHPATDALQHVIDYTQHRAR